MSLKLKLVNVYSDTHEAEVGTCDLCLGTDVVREDIFTFRAVDEEENKEFIHVNGFYWKHGTISRLWIKNYIVFAEWFNAQDIVVDSADEMDYSWLDNLAEQFYKFQHS